MAKNKQKYPETAFVPAGVLIGIGYGFLTSNIPCLDPNRLGIRICCYGYNPPSEEKEIISYNHR